MWRRTLGTLDVRSVARWVLLAGWPVHVVFAVMVLATLAVAITTRQPTVQTGTLLLALHYAVGLCGSFVLHELGHALVLARASGVTALTLERTLWRISVSAHGSILGRDMALAAIAGPGGCVALGAVLLLACPQFLLYGWFLAHGVFLLPVFADGRALIRGIRSWGRRIGCSSARPSRPVRTNA